MDTTLTIKTDKKLKGAAQNIAAALGVPLTTIINAMLKQLVRDQEITLSARRPNVTTRAAMREVQRGEHLESFEFLKARKKGMRPI